MGGVGMGGNLDWVEHDLSVSPHVRVVDLLGHREESLRAEVRVKGLRADAKLRLLCRVKAILLAD